MPKVVNYTPTQFIDDAKKIFDGPATLKEKQLAAAERLKLLAQRDDLTRWGVITGPTDACNDVYSLRRDQGFSVSIAVFDQYYRSPVHAHENQWVVGCGYRGHERWDVYERLDDGSKPGYADLRLADQWPVRPGDAVIMPEPPLSNHSHNNLADGPTLEIIFTAAPPLEFSKRLIYDVEAKTCEPTRWRPHPLLDRRYSLERPARQVAVAFSSLGGAFLRLGCPVCALTPSPA